MVRVPRPCVVFAALLCTQLVWAATPVTAVAGEGGDADWEDFIRAYSALDRIDLRGIEPTVFAVDVAPDGALRVAVDWRTGTPRTLHEDLPVDISGAGCAGTGTGSGVPWAVSPFTLGTCAHPGARYGWGILQTTMTCQGTADYCFTDGFNGLPSTTPGAFVLTCGLPQVAVVDWPGGTSTSLPLAAQCGLFAFGAPPPVWSAWESVCAHAFGAPGLYACAHLGA